MYFRFAVLSLFIILTYNYSSESFVRKSNQQEGLGDCRTRVKGFALHRTIMTLTGESEEVNNNEERVIELKREKRNRKTAVTKTHHNVERLSASGEDPELIQNEVDTLWKVLEACLAVMDELQKAYLHLGDNDSKKSVAEEAEGLENETNNAIEKAERVVKDILEKKHVGASKDVLPQTPPMNLPPQPVHSPAYSHSSGSQNPGNCSQRLKPLKVPVFNGEKSKFEDFWEMFLSLVDQGGEPSTIKMARLRQSLTGTALEAIRGLGVTEPEYNEAKDILQSKFGGERRKLQAYMDQIEKMPPLKSADVQSFERFADLVRIAVVKLQAEGRGGVLGDGTLHSLLVKKLADSQVESYSRWLREHKKDKSVLTLRDWLKEEVRVRVEAVEMAHGIEAEPVGGAAGGGKHGDRGHGSRSFFGENSNFGKETPFLRSKPPCAYCKGNHGVWSC